MVNVEISAPVRSKGDWACRLRIKGLPSSTDQLVYGIDAVQALELALVASGKLLADSPQFRAGQIERYGERITEPAALSLPLPMYSLQGSLENLGAYLERLRVRGKASDEWRRGLLVVMRQISADLATLAAHLPLKPREKTRLRPRRR